MASVTQEKRPAEKIPLAGDFTQLLAPFGDALIGGNVDVKIYDQLTDVDVTSTILVPSSPAAVGSAITCEVQAGTAGTAYRVVFSTGTTTLGNSWALEATLLVTLYVSADETLCELDEVKRRLKLTDTTDDRLLSDLIRAASAYFRQRTGRVFTVRIYADTLEFDYDEPHQRRFRVSEWPLLKIDSIKTIASDDTEEVIATTDVRISEDGYVWRKDSGVYWPRGIQIQVVYRAGYQKLPDDIREACKSIAIGFYRLITREGLTSERIGDYAYTRKPLPAGTGFEISDEIVEGIINRYKRRDVG